MKMKKILTLMLVSLLLGVEQEAAAGDQTAGAAIRLHATQHNFGDAPRRGGDLSYELHFTNEGTAPLVLTRVVTSCSCLKAHFQRRPVAPGGEGVIRIVYEPQKSEPGTFSKVVQIYSNAESGRVIFTVQGNSLEEERVKVKNDKVKIKR